MEQTAVGLPAATNGRNFQSRVSPEKAAADSGDVVVPGMTRFSLLWDKPGVSESEALPTDQSRVIGASTRGN
jgi:hypothetical protein